LSEEETHLYPGLFWVNDGPICLTTNYHYASPQNWDFKKMLEEFWFRSAYIRNIDVFGGSLRSWEKLTIEDVLKALKKQSESKHPRHAYEPFGGSQHGETLKQFIERIDLHRRCPGQWHNIR
jgi:hypothetical protein